MPSNPRLAALLAIASITAALPAAFAESPGMQQERVAASFVLALGRAPTPGEVEAWAKPEARSVADLLARHRQALGEDAAARRAVAARAFEDAFGRAANEDEIRAGAAEAGTYTERVQRHLQGLGQRPAAYEEVLGRAYRLVVGRDVYPEEIAYWKRRDTLSYALLVGCVEDWARRNQPGLMVTTGAPTISVNSVFLVTVRLSPAVAAEARTAAGLGPAGDADHAIASFGRNLVAPGAGDVLSGGRIHFVAAGGAALAPARPDGGRTDSRG